MNDVLISVFASSIRHELYDDFFRTLESEPLFKLGAIEVVFAGNRLPQREYENLTYIETANIKPAQCYEVARRACCGEVVVWAADDCEFVGGILSQAYQYWADQNNDKLILSIQTRETGLSTNYDPPILDMNVHRFFGGRRASPLMAPLGMMSRKYLDELGGIDRRYVCGQYENDIVMRAYADGGSVEIFGDEQKHIWIDHIGKLGSKKAFYDRPFGQYYPSDRNVLESCWCSGSKVNDVRSCPVEPFDDENILTMSQSNKGMWD